MNASRANLQHRPFLTPIWLTVLAAFAAFAVALLCVWVWFTANSTTVIVIRHAEKETATAVDPPLSPAGEARAELLARMFGDTHGVGRLDGIYVSDTLRSRSTAAPLAARLGISVTVAPNNDSKRLANRVLSENSGKRVMIVGHTNTVPELVAALSGRGDIPGMDEKDYGVMYIVTVPRIGRANVLRLNY
ncbi:MAG TPA: histidine phosphatase family protein [Steroidobacteraceae bacterium]|jgi:phosphohistidine phosphatase SixA|nr:histidine phosphatase family protein [Steroidobacteraceae bacterium]